jgi:hypothetical protein
MGQTFRNLFEEYTKRRAGRRLGSLPKSSSSGSARNLSPVGKPGKSSYVHVTMSCVLYGLGNAYVTIDIRIRSSGIGIVQLERNNCAWDEPPTKARGQVFRNIHGKHAEADERRYHTPDCRVIAEVSRGITYDDKCLERGVSSHNFSHGWEQIRVVFVSFL